MGFHDLDDIDVGDSDATFDESTGHHFGLSYSFGSDALRLRPGVFYHQIGTYDSPDADARGLARWTVRLNVRF